MTVRIGVIGGDLRCGYMVSALAKRGADVYKTMLDCPLPLPPYVKEMKSCSDMVELCPAIILPVPVCIEGMMLNTPFSREKLPLEKLLPELSGKTVLGGVVTGEITAMAAAAGIEIIDVMKREELAVANAVPTAEGAIAIAMRDTPDTIFGTECAVIGYGRLGRALAPRLAALGARVTVCARKSSDIAWASASGFSVCKTSELERLCGRCSIFFNTVPALVLDAKALDRMEGGELVIDLASKPGGVDFDFARAAGIKTVRALSLPGKVAPKYAGEALVGPVLSVLEERGYAL